MHGVVGVRLTGAGFGGCLLVAHDPGAASTCAGRWSSPARASCRRVGQLSRAERDDAVEHVGRRAARRGSRRRARSALVDRSTPVRGDERGGGVEHDDVAHRTGRAAEDCSCGDPALCAASPPRIASSGAHRDAVGRRVQPPLVEVDVARGVVVDLERRGCDPTGTPRRGRPRHGRRARGRTPRRATTAAMHVVQHGVRDAEEQSADLRGVRHRSEEVEDRADAECDADRRDRGERWVERRREAEAEPGLLDASRDDVGPGAIVTPSASSRSAEPTLELALRLPCLTTGTPAPATTSAAIVDTLTEPERSPRSRRRRRRGGAASAGSSRCTPRAVIASSSPTSSSAVGPLAASATRKPATCSGATARPRGSRRAPRRHRRRRASGPRRASSIASASGADTAVSPTTGRGRARPSR